MKEIEVLVKKSKTKSCANDPVPTSILKLCIGMLSKYITIIVNYSLREATFPGTLRQARIIPSLKKASLDINELSKYRLITNIPYLSKIIEKIIVL